MKKRLLFSIIIIAIGFASHSQQLPRNTCGIVNIYDAAGNRTKRVYFCNNGVDTYPARIASQQQADGIDPKEIEMVNALYPNPTTGKFSVTFSKALKNATITINDINGRIIQNFMTSGNKVEFNLSAATAGVYFIRINDGGNLITNKIVKQ